MNKLRKLEQYVFSSVCGNVRWLNMLYAMQYHSEDTWERGADQPVLLPGGVHRPGQWEVLQRLQGEDPLGPGPEHGGRQEALGSQREADELGPDLITSSQEGFNRTSWSILQLTIWLIQLGCLMSSIVIWSCIKIILLTWLVSSIIICFCMKMISLVAPH